MTARLALAALLLLAGCRGGAPTAQPSGATADEERAVREAEAMIGTRDAASPPAVEGSQPATR